MEDEEFEVRWRAAEGLIKMDVNGLKPLLQALIRNGDSVFLREGVHRVLHKVARGELRNFLLPVLNALESTWSLFEVPIVALRALESLEKLQGARGKMDTVSPKEFTATTSNQSTIDLGARRRAQRYAKSLR